jgi:antiviral helicase SKI2
MKVDVDMILERQRISVMNDVVQQLDDVLQDWKKSQLQTIPEVDWSKIRQLEFQENLRTRRALEARLEGKACVSCDKFDEHVCISRIGFSIIPDDYISTR